MAVTVSDDEQRRISELEHAITSERAELRTKRLYLLMRLPLAIAIGLPLFLVTYGAFGAEVATAIVGTAALAETALARRRKLARAVAETASARAVGALAVAYRSVDSETRSAALSGLRRLLPAVRDDHLVDISPDAMQALIALLRADDTRLVLGALHALGEVGGRIASPAVERLARGEYEASWRKQSWLFGHPPYALIRRSAENGLERIRRRIASEEYRDRLLRPAMASNEVLLRPSYHHVDGPQNLLQPVEHTHVGQDSS
jgi:hypothetical protein